MSSSATTPEDAIASTLPSGQATFTRIPAAHFVDDVDAFMSGEDSAEERLKSLDEQHQKYKFMEANLSAKRRRLKGQIPDIAASLDTIAQLAKKEESEANFLLSDQVYAKAVLPPTEKVCLWLGANVMLEYSLKDAEDLLTKNKSSAQENLQQIAHDLDYLRDQMTITEVTMARIYNWDVRRRQQQQQQKKE